MSNLVTPMMASVDNSPTVDFYPKSICFSSSSPRSIITANDSRDDWTDLERLVTRGALFKTSTPNKSHYSTIIDGRRTFTNNFTVAIDNIDNESRNHGNDEISGVINKVWEAPQRPHAENNSCSGVNVNNMVNMGYNDGSSLESMISNKNVKTKPELFLNKSIVECNSNAIPIEPICKVTEPTVNKIFQSPIPVLNSNLIKTFKNGSKTGHSRQWGSCGSAVTLQLNCDDKNIKSKLSLELNTQNTTNSAAVVVANPPTEIRNKSYSQNNGIKRISQLSFEAEFDSEGRTHEQITIDFRKYEPYLIAGQITQLELSFFKAVKSEEFLSFKWTGVSKNTHAPGIVASTRWFNQLNYWAQRSILECSEINRRTEMLAYLIRIIKKLVDTFNNLSSGMALMSALEVECIHRLKITWNNLSSKDRATFRRMEELFSSANNYEKLREHINLMKLPCIPYLGLYLTDLTYINLAHSKVSEFESQTKTDQMNNILRTVSEFQQSEYEICQNPLLYRYLESQRYIEELQKIIEENNYRTSMSLEPVIPESCSQPSRQQDFNTISPQKTPPSYACKHSTNKTIPPLQSPISPKPISSQPHNESIKEVSEQQMDNQLTLSGDEDNNETPTNENCNLSNILNSDMKESPAVISNPENINLQPYEESLMLSSRYSDDDNVRVSLLCGAGRKSYFKKRSTSTSIRFKRDSSSSSRQQASSKTATLSSTSQSDKELMGHHSKSLLDDSYLDSTLIDAGPATLEAVTRGIGHGDVSVVSSKPSEALCSPPLCRCIIKGDTVDLKPKASTKRKTQYSNLVNIALASETAAQFKKNESFYISRDCDNGVDVEADINNREQFKLVCQGVLSRQDCMKNSKRSRFSTWNRYWMVLMTSKDNAFLTFFENDHFRAIEQKDFKSKKCYVQDLKKVNVSRTRPTLNTNICEQTSDLSQSSQDKDLNQTIKKFFLIDKEYGLMYKFRDPSCNKSKSNTKDKSSTEQEQCLQDSQSNDQMPSVLTWYKLLKKSIKRINGPNDEHKDLIVLVDS